MTRITDVLHTIWQHSWGGLIFLPSRDSETGQWHENPGVSYLDADLTQPTGHDFYFTPGCYRRGPRKAENLADLGVLYADLDTDYDPAALISIRPSVLWETSPDSLQAVWFIYPSNMPADWTIDLNHKLSIFMRADAGSWIPTKLLRVPESVNWKRGGVRGNLLEFDRNLTYNAVELSEEWFIRNISLPESELDVWGVPNVPTLSEWKATLDKWWPSLPVNARRMLTQPQVSDRSLHLSRLAFSMATISMPPHEIFGILSRLPTNKFSKRPEVLWNSVVLPAVGQVRR